MAPTKIDLPKLTGDLTASSVTTWLNLCQDSFEAWSLMNPDCKLPVPLQILLAGLKLEAPAAAQWWSENREGLKVLSTWKEFVDALKERFVPGSWRLDALSTFYMISQGSTTFPDFVARLQQARTTLGSAGRGFLITNSVMKCHLLFRANRLLRLRICAIPSFNFADIKVDALISLMNSTWLSMIAEGVVTDARSQPHLTSSSSTNAAGLSTSERESLRAAGGCFHCRLTPKSPGWTPHLAVNCPGNKILGIPPRAPSATAPPKTTAVFGISERAEESSPEIPDASVFAVFPPASAHGVHLVQGPRYYNSDDEEYEDAQNVVLGWNPQKGRCDTDSEEDMTRSDDGY